MEKKISRKDFLKFSGATSVAGILPWLHLSPSQTPTDKLPNILILVLDSLSAKHLSFYGYSRKTTPNINKLVKNATVYHQHYSAGNYTYPSTSSLLTGTYPWTHRGFHKDRGISPKFHHDNIFQLLNKYHRLGLTQNHLVEELFFKMEKTIDKHKLREDFLLHSSSFSETVFRNDKKIAEIALWFSLKNSTATYSPFFSRIVQLFRKYKFLEYYQFYPRGLPSDDGEIYLFEPGIDWLISQFTTTPEPFLGYIHYMPPHDPYNTREEFVNTFKNDEFLPEKKEDHIFSLGYSYETNKYLRRVYDEYILLADNEIGRIFNSLKNSKLLDNTIIVLTSDHGEMFERGIWQHYHESLHQPVVHIPLLIFFPGQTERIDISTPSSTVDIVPTLQYLVGEPIPDWIEGKTLPPFGESEPNRAVYAVEAKNNVHTDTINPVSLMIVKNGYKLTYYAGWERMKGADPIVELYAIEDDPEEMNNLANELPEMRDGLLAEVLEKAKG